jgi:AmmeMemoRadiSam system protein A
MSSPEARREVALGGVLLDVARASIEHGFRVGMALEVDPEAYPRPLRAWGASFVTLHRGGALRGCIGTLDAARPLVEDVAHNAFAAANRDPRFPPLEPAERDDTDVSVSVLSPPEPLDVRRESDLLGALEPGVHGLRLAAGPHRATFLPQVWEQLPDPRDFLARLVEKADLPDGIPWSRIEAARYTVESFEGPLATSAS